MTDFSFLKNINNIPPLDILVAPHPILKKQASPVTHAHKNIIKDSLPGMFSAMYKASGIGLAAPQIGLSLNFVIIDLSDREQEEAPDPILLINPEIIFSSEEISIRKEGCLSLPNQFAEVERPEKIKVRYQDLDGNYIEREEDGLLGTCIQHEMDHLKGTLFVDHLTSLKRNMIMRRLKKEQKRK